MKQPRVPADTIDRSGRGTGGAQPGDSARSLSPRHSRGIGALPSRRTAANVRTPRRQSEGARLCAPTGNANELTLDPGMGGLDPVETGESVGWLDGDGARSE